jgi:hypothetical protein
MELQQIFRIIENDSLANIKSHHYFNRYKKIISIYVNRIIDLEKTGDLGEFESHHILPKSMYPDLKKEKWNLVRLPTRVHYLVHYLLFKSFSDDGLTFAFNQMRRITKTKRPNCKLYESVRKDFAQTISKNNKGKQRDAIFKNACAERTKNTNVYRSPDGELRRFTIGSEPYDWVSFQNGRVRTNDSKKLIKDIMKERVWQYNQITREVKFEHTILDGFLKGFPPWFEINGKKCKDSIWIHHAIEKTNKRLKVNEQIPKGYVFGRFFESNPGLDRLNNGHETLVLDLMNKEYILVDKSLLPNARYKKHGTSLDKVFLFKYNNTVYTSMKDMCDHLGISRFPSNPSFLQKIIPKKHWNQTKNMQKISEKFGGKTYNQAGFSAISLLEYEFKEEEIYVRY